MGSRWNCCLSSEHPTPSGRAAYPEGSLPRRMAIPWAAQQQDAELLTELAGYSLSLATIGLGMSLLHLQRQLVLELLELEQLAQTADRSEILR